MRRLELTDSEHRDLLSRLIAEKAAYSDAARQAEKQGKGLGDGWRRQAEAAHTLIHIVNAAETF